MRESRHRTHSGRPRRRGRPSSSVQVRAGDVAIMRKAGRATKTIGSRVGWTFTWEDGSDWSPYVTADVLLADVSAGVLEEHVEAIKAGKRAGTGTDQPKLDPRGQSGKDAAAGKRSRARGNARDDGKGLADQLARSKVKARGNAKIGKGRLGTSASCTIGPGTAGHASYLAKEHAKRGIEFFDVDGRVALRIDADLSRVIDIALSGLPFDASAAPDFGELRGGDLR